MAQLVVVDLMKFVNPENVTHIVEVDSTHTEIFFIGGNSLIVGNKTKTVVERLSAPHDTDEAIREFFEARSRL